MDNRDVLIDLAKHYEEKIKKKQTISARRPISHIDAFYGRGSSSGLMNHGGNDSFIDQHSSMGHANQSVNNLNSLIQRVQHEQD